MEKQEVFEERVLALQKAKPPFALPGKLTRETFFKYFKPRTDGKVFTKSGYEIKSEQVLALVKKLRQCMANNDFNGFLNQLDENLENKAITDDDWIYLYKAIITDKRRTLAELIDDIDDLERDGYVTL